MVHRLDIEDYKTWGDLAREFLRQYKFNVEVLPTREDLVRMKKRMNEDLKAYSQRWRTVASQVKPAILGDELIELFLKSLPFEYFERMHVSGSPSFFTLVRVGERYEWGLKENKAMQEAEGRAYSARKGKEAAEVAFVAPTNSHPAQNVRFQQSAWQVPRTYEPRKQFTPRQYTPLPCPLSQLLPMLLEGRLVVKEVPRESPPRFNGFDLGKSCEFHMGDKDHIVDNCLVLKNKVHNLIDQGMLDFKEPEPNINNSLLNHHGVNLILEGNVELDNDDEERARREGDRMFIENARVNHEDQEEFIPDGWDDMEFDKGLEDDDAQFMMEETYVENLAMTINELVIDHSMEEEVAVITPYVIHLPGVRQNVEMKTEPKPMMIMLTQEMSDMTLKEPEQVHPVIIELPPRKSIDTKAVPWHYSSSEVDVVTRSGMCYIDEKGKKVVIEEEGGLCDHKDK